MARKDERREARRRAIEHDAKTSGGSGKGGQSFFLPPEELEKLGVKEYKANAKEDSSAQEHVLHIMPPHPDDGDPIGLKLYVHWSVGPENAAYLCPLWMKQVVEWYNEHGADIEMPEAIADGRCPICERGDKLGREYQAMKTRDPDGDYEAIIAELQDLRPYWGWREKRPNRWMLWMVNATSAETEDEGIQVYSCPAGVYDVITTSLCHDRKTGVFDITDPVDGKVVIFSRKGKKKNDTKYFGYLTEARDPLPEEWADDVPRYMAALRFAGYDEIAAAFGDIEPVEAGAAERERLADETGEAMEADTRQRRQAEDAEDEGEKPRRRSRRPRTEAAADEPEPEKDRDEKIEEIRGRVAKRRRSRREPDEK